MFTPYLIIASVGIIALIVIVIVAIKIERAINRRREFGNLNVSNQRDLFDEEIKKLARAHSETLQATQWLEERLKKGRPNLSEVIRNTNCTARALTIHRAEEAVVLAESALADVQETIVKKQKALNNAIAQSWTSSITKLKPALKDLNQQEILCRKRADEARRRLSQMTIMVKAIEDAGVASKPKP